MHPKAGWILVFLLILIAGCTEKNVYQEPPPTNVKVASPVVQTVTIYLEETASTEAVARVAVRARVEGFLKSVNFEPGNMVKEGDLLYEIEPELYEARFESAEAELLARKARLMEAENDKTRQERIRAQNPGATSEATVVAAQAEFQAAEAAVMQAEAQLKQAKIDLNYTRVVSPINGRVGKTLVKPGNLVGSGGMATELTTVLQYDPIYANFNISERELLELRSTAEDSSTGEINREELRIGLSRENDPGFPFQGRFDYADLTVDQSTGTFMIRGIFPNPDRRIIPGLFVTVRLPIGTQENALLIPERAVAVDQAGRFLLAVNSENEVERRNVTVGMKVGEFVVIEQGLQGEDVVIIDGLQRSRPGAKVTPERIELALESTAVETVQVGGKPAPIASREGADVTAEVTPVEELAPLPNSKPEP